MQRPKWSEPKWSHQHSSRISSSGDAGDSCVFGSKFPSDFIPDWFKEPVFTVFVSAFAVGTSIILSAAQVVAAAAATAAEATCAAASIAAAVAKWPPCSELPLLRCRESGVVLTPVPIENSSGSWYKLNSWWEARSLATAAGGRLADAAFSAPAWAAPSARRPDVRACWPYIRAVLPWWSRRSTIWRSTREESQLRTSWKPARPAKCRALCPFRFSFATSALLSTSRRQISLAGAKNSGVCPCRSAASMSALEFRRTLHSSAFPSKTAMCKGVTPFTSESLGLALQRSSSLAKSARPARETAIKGPPGPCHLRKGSGTALRKRCSTWIWRCSIAALLPSPSKKGLRSWFSVWLVKSSASGRLAVGLDSSTWSLAEVGVDGWPPTLTGLRAPPPMITGLRGLSSGRVCAIPRPRVCGLTARAGGARIDGTLSDALRRVANGLETRPTLVALRVPGAGEIAGETRPSTSAKAAADCFAAATSWVVRGSGTALASTKASTPHCRSSCSTSCADKSPALSKHLRKAWDSSFKTSCSARSALNCPSKADELVTSCAHMFSCSLATDNLDWRNLSEKDECPQNPTKTKLFLKKICLFSKANKKNSQKAQSGNSRITGVCCTAGLPDRARLTEGVLPHGSR